MNFGLLGKKLGMTRIFTQDGDSIPVTLVLCNDNRVVQVKRPDVDGYSAIQVAYGSRKPNKLTRSLKGHYRKYSVPAAEFMSEFLLTPDEIAARSLNSGVSIGLEEFLNKTVIVTGTSKGKGFAGVIKRYNFSSNWTSHGNSRSHRTVGSTGQRQDPGRVFPGKKMPGHLGNVRRTVRNLRVVRVEGNVLFIRGAIPGHKGSRVKIRLLDME